MYKQALNDEHRYAIQEWIDEDCGITLQALKNKLLEKYQISVCQKTVDRCINAFSYTVKNCSIIPARRNDPKTITARYDYAVNYFQLISKISEDEIIYVDEVGFNVSMRTRKGRSLIGSPAVHVVPAIRSRNISVYCAMGKMELLIL